MQRYIVKITIIGILLILVAGCKDATNVTISGKLEVAAEADVWIGVMDLERTIPVDSMLTDKNGEFTIELKVEHPSMFYLTVGSRPIYLIVKPKDKIEVSIDNSLGNAPYYVEGSTDSRLVQELMTKQERVLDRITQLSTEYEASKQDVGFIDKKDKFDSTYSMLLKNHRKYTKELIYDNPKSLAGIFAVYQNFGKKNQPLFDRFEDYNIFNYVDSNLTALYPFNPAVQALNKELIETKEQIKHKKYSDRLTEPGRKAPDFVVETIDGQNIQLTELAGNPVVYFFFAVWSKPSVEEAKALSELYRNYKYTGLKVIGVSFDTEADRLNEFIESNGISFPVVCDYKYWDSELVQQFGVRKIPAILLLDPNHIVAKKNINTSELKFTLGEWRKNKEL